MSIDPGIPSSDGGIVINIGGQEAERLSEVVSLDTEGRTATVVRGKEHSEIFDNWIKGLKFTHVALVLLHEGAPYKTYTMDLPVVTKVQNPPGDSPQQVVTFRYEKLTVS
ncbi:hypothetical protein [Streptomyces sp. HNM0574]|uniref:hypothetical protein n=1 Tax=Streptomyces sp. HNM0574 TaxID=2714954 RepID=UPI00146C550D|nr:hypothetical protein [Streptomyces sp. HNM0574]NLU68274.1 hypothetical protein [Streptomyces sp. HNM0574]